jgi:hypothetical protein
MVELSSDDVESCGAASVGLVANDLRISKLALFITCASTCDLSLQLLFASSTYLRWCIHTNHTLIPHMAFRPELAQRP